MVYTTLQSDHGAKAAACTKYPTANHAAQRTVHRK